MSNGHHKRGVQASMSGFPRLARKGRLNSFVRMTDPEASRYVERLGIFFDLISSGANKCQLNSVKTNQLKLIVYDAKTEEITQWLN